MRAFIARSLVFFIIALVVPCARTQPRDETIIIGDISGSMRGFAKAGANRLAALYRLLIRNISNAQLRALTTNLIPVPQNGPHFFAVEGNYRGNTDLVAGITRIHERCPQAVLVTDGMQSEGMYLGIKLHLKRMASEGWGIWLFGLDMPFDGVIDAEQPVDLTTFRQDIEACVRKHDPNSQVIIRPGANRFFEYRGLRTLLIFVFFKDASAGRQVAQRVFSNLQADPQFAPRVKVAELAPLIRRGVDISEPEKADLSDYLQIDNFSSGSPIIRSDTADRKRIKGLRIPVVWRGDPSPIQQALVEVPKYDRVLPSWVNDERPVGIQPGQDANRVIDNIEIRIISDLPWYKRWVSGRDEKSEVLNLTLWTEFVMPESGWWDNLNTDNSWQCPAKVYKLSELVKDVATVAAERHKANNPPKTVTFKLIVGPL